MNPAPAHDLFSALADPTRVRILALLLRGEQCVGDLVTILKLAQPTASRHLSVLRRAGMVRVRTADPWKFYSLQRPAGAVHARVLECVKACARTLPQLARDEAARVSLQRKGGCCPGHSCA